MIVIGCDPGVTGAFAVVQDGRLVEVLDMPMQVKRVNRKDRNSIDENGVADFLRIYSNFGAKRFIIERVGGLPGQSASRSFTFGYGFGVVLSTARMLHFETELVTPQAWKGALINRETGFGTGVVTPKSASMNAATFYFGKEHWPRAKDHGRAEAALIALYGTKHIWVDKPTGKTE